MQTATWEHLQTCRPTNYSEGSPLGVRESRKAGRTIQLYNPRLPSIPLQLESSPFHLSFFSPYWRWRRTAEFDNPVHPQLPVLLHFNAEFGRTWPDFNNPHPGDGRGPLRPRPVRIRIGSRDFGWSETRNSIQIPTPDSIGNPTFGDHSAAQRHKVLLPTDSSLLTTESSSSLLPTEFSSSLLTTLVFTLVVLALADRVPVIVLFDRALVLTAVILTLIDRLFIFDLVDIVPSESREIFPHQLRLLTTTKCTPNSMPDSSKFRLGRTCIFYRSFLSLFILLPTGAAALFHLPAQRSLCREADFTPICTL
ncbi:hypothetical protein THAR02_03446 [Trichoderma harzianum]|uniref:Uncharacterized protein n=1 Tax=Trichoderma harzianum TaxID=5544 RepID=A0A0G0AHF0_TRIHA|nr:hypothetical protein THAR02_03446 [Trichoderma harzianum]